MCYEAENIAWCDGTQNEFNNQYFNDNEEKPYGFKEEVNRKYNTEFKYNTCWWNWQCATGHCRKVMNLDDEVLACVYASGVWPKEYPKYCIIFLNLI